jgi:hypothetical protein
MRLIAPTPLVGRFLTLAIIMAGFVFSMAVNLPGHLSYDSVMQLLEGRAGTYSGWHPPAMSWLLGLADAAMPGTALFVFANSLLFFAALASLVWTKPQTSWFAPLTAAVLVLSPQFLLYQGVVWKDVLFANAGVAGFAILAHLGPAWRSPRLRYSLLALGFALLVLAALSRQNGIILILFGALAVAWTGRLSGLSRASSVALGGMALTGSVAVLLLTNVALQTRVSGLWGPVRQLKLLEMYDLTGALAAQPDIGFEQLKQSDPQLVALMQTDGRRLYSPQRTDTFIKSNALERARAAAPIEPLRRQWLEFIGDHPWLYLRIRAQVFRWIFLTPEIRLCVPFYLGIDGPPGLLKWLGIKARYDDRDQALATYGEHFLGTPAFSHPFWFLLALGEAAFLFFRRRVSDIAIGMLLAAAIAFTATFFVIAIACDYRYLYFLDLAAITGLFYIALDPRPSRSFQSPNG